MFTIILFPSYNESSRPEIPTFGYTLATLLQNYYKFTIIQSVFSKNSILFLTFAEN